ncbi:MAG TPA: glycoside hydrolase family 18 protein [Draconibacterium sp.]|nr:glycoside hydrolase family 18 protein [Draconibacterium sp.]
MNTRFSLLLFFLLLFACKSKEVQQKTTSDTSINIMAYYFPREEFDPEQLQLDKLTHLIFSFSHVVDGKMVFNSEEDGKRLEQLVSQKQKYPGLKVMVACGGWEADGFSDAVLTEESRKIFIESAVELIEKYRLDGLDIDWEYPTSDEAGIKARPEDKENFTALMKGLRVAMNELDRPLTLTFAAAGWKGYFNYIELQKVMPLVDYINLMTYDQAGGENQFTAHHTALGKRTLDDLKDTPLGKQMIKQNSELEEGEMAWEPQSVESIVEFCLQQGVPAEKIVVGAAFYGKGWKGVDPVDNGLFQPNKGGTRGVNYNNLLKEYINKNGYTRYWDSIAKAPYLYNPADSIFITYDDPESVALKTRFVIDQHLGGIMFWELGGDTVQENGLLDAIYMEAHP